MTTYPAISLHQPGATLIATLIATFRTRDGRRECRTCKRARSNVGRTK